MYYDTQLEYEYESMNEIIESEMHNARDNSLLKVSSIIVHPQKLFSIKDFAMTLAYGYFDSYTPTENISNSLNLSKLDFLAIIEDFDAFKEEYLKNYEEAQNF